MFQVAFEVMNIMGVITNCTLIYLCPSVQQYSTMYGELALVMMFVLAEVSSALFYRNKFDVI